MILLDPLKLEQVRRPIDEMVVEICLTETISTTAALKAMIQQLGCEPLVVGFKDWWFAGAVHRPVEESVLADWVDEIRFTRKSRRAANRALDDRANALSECVFEQSVCASRLCLALEGLLVRLLDSSSEIGLDGDEWWRWYPILPPDDHRLAWRSHYRALLDEIRNDQDEEACAIDRANELVRIGRYDRFEHALTQTLLLDQDGEDYFLE